MKKEDLRITKTKKNLYNGLLMLMKENTFEEIKVSDICSIALVNRSTFYDHFDDKYELLESLIKDLKEDLIQKLKENRQIDNAREYYIEMIKLLMDHTKDNIMIYSSILKHNNNSIVMDMVYDTVYKDVENYIDEHENITAEIPAEIISKFYVSAVINVCLDYIKSPHKYKKEDILEYLSKLIPIKIY